MANAENINKVVTIVKESVKKGKTIVELIIDFI